MKAISLLAGLFGWAFAMAQPAPANSDIRIQRPDYSITSPSDWEADSSGQQGADLFLFSPATDSADTFRENINVLIQRLPDESYTLDRYIELTEDQVPIFLENGQIQQSERFTRNGHSYHHLIYAGGLKGTALKFEQLIFIRGLTAYIVTYTAPTEQFENYRSAAVRSLDSFHLK